MPYDKLRSAYVDNSATTTEYFAAQWRQLDLDMHRKQKLVEAMWIPTHTADSRVAFGKHQNFNALLDVSKDISSQHYIRDRLPILRLALFKVLPCAFPLEKAFSDLPSNSPYDLIFPGLPCGVATDVGAVVSRMVLRLRGCLSLELDRRRQVVDALLSRLVRRRYLE